ncbi:CD225/dispanin family protein [Hamadaea sp. NPDC051192]|uniref:CD225/dispanin family protein n=1 Tax=Hamadaea sp. NPDC051192 TaxID=3154940 RepID=UPI0034157BDB
MWLGLSIAATLFCCTPLGIVGIVFSAMAMDANSRGDHGLAEARTERAKSWTL